MSAREKLEGYSMQPELLIDGGRVRRVNPDHNKRGDGEWQVLVSRFPETPVVGSPMVLVMESLSRYGEDDYGTSPEFVGDTTTRTTTPVVRICRNMRQLSEANE